MKFKGIYRFVLIFGWVCIALCTGKVCMGMRMGWSLLMGERMIRNDRCSHVCANQGKCE